MSLVRRGPGSEDLGAVAVAPDTVGPERPSRPRPRVAFQGALGAFSEEAVHRFFAEAEPIACHAFTDVVAAVRSGAVEYGVLPVENTIHGCVTGSYDALAGSGVEILGETILPIRHCLLATAGTGLDGIRRVISHPVALAQCGRYLAGLDGADVVAVYDTAGAAEEVARSRVSGLAAVASRGAAERYDLEILAEGIQDTDDNQTRFLVVGLAGRLPHRTRSGRWKTALIAETPNRPGALHELLSVFAEAGINLTQLNARPAETPWTYRFFLEYEHETANRTLEAVERARDVSESLEVLGTFPSAVDAGSRV